MTDPSHLLAEAQAISTSSANIRKFAVDAATNIVAQDTRIAALEAKLATAPAPAPTTTAALPVLVKALLLAEEFDAPLNTAMWDVKNRGSDSGTIFDAYHYLVGNSCLDIWATKDSTGVWRSAEIQTLAPTYQYVGPRYMEASAKLPTGYGTWPAPLWEWNAPWGGLHIENDVNEQLGREPGKYHVTVHDTTAKGFGKVIDTGLDLSAAFHSYGAAVYADRVDYYFDRVLRATITKVEAFAGGLVDWHLVDTPMVALCDLDMGGSWAGTPTIAGPVHMLVDYIRIWSL